MSAFRWAVALVALMVTACGMETKRVDPDQDDAIGGTGFDAADVRQTADLMARSLLDRPDLFAKGTPFVVIESPENRTRFPIDSSIFVNRLRTLLIQSAQGRIRFLAREDLPSVLAERERKRSGAVSVPTDAAGKPDLAAAPLGTQYFLKGTLQALSKTDGKGASDYIQVSFRLTDAETSEITWEDLYEWKKVGQSGVIYR